MSKKLSYYKNAILIFCNGSIYHKMLLSLSQKLFLNKKTDNLTSCTNGNHSNHSHIVLWNITVYFHFRIYWECVRYSATHILIFRTNYIFQWVTWGSSLNMIGCLYLSSNFHTMLDHMALRGSFKVSKDQVILRDLSWFHTLNMLLWSLHNKYVN